MIIALNGSPRLKGNTATMLQYALDGAASVGIKGKLIHLYPLNPKGCCSCFSCKLKTGRHGHCALKDNLSPVLEELETADAIIFGSPIYYSNITPELHALLQRFLFSHMLYNKKDRWIFPKKTPSAFIYTCGVSGKSAEDIPGLFSIYHSRMEFLLGIKPQIFVSPNAWQFENYNLYEADQFDVEDKKKYRTEEFPKDCQRAFELGKNLITVK